MTELTEEQTRHRGMIEREAARHGLTVDSWSQSPDDDDRDQAHFGRWVVSHDDEDRGLLAGDEGELTCTVVGGVEYHNEQAAFYLNYADREVGDRVVPYEDVEPV